MVYLNGGRYSVVEKRAYCDRGKKLYRKYCCHLKKNPDLECNRLVKNIRMLLPLIAKFEAECLERMRESDIAGDKIDLKQILSDDQNIDVFLHKPIDVLIKELLGDKSYTALGEDNKVVYISESGRKYHRKDCQYCKRIHLVSATMAKVKNMQLEPCKCMEGSSNSENRQNGQPIHKKPYVTAFVDESVRKNPWRNVDESIPKQQAIYSYIICKGMLDSENDITDDNTLYTCVAPVLETNNVTRTAIEAIQAVLFALVLEGYCDNVLIYTDNVRAKDSWTKSEACKNIGKLFTSVTVCHIPREKNKKADKLGRKTAILEVPTKTMDKILRRDKQVKTILEGWYAERKRV